MISPFAQREHVSHVVLDHTSILKMIEWRWNLPPLTVGDEGANNLAAVLDFAAPNLKTKQFSVPAGPFGQLCLPAAAAPQADAEWLPLLNMAAEFGWPVRLPVLLA